MVHLNLLDAISIFQEKTFQSSLFITSFSASFLEEVITEVIPPQYEKCPAVEMSWGLKNNLKINKMDGKRVEYFQITEKKLMH